MTALEQPVTEPAPPSLEGIRVAHSVYPSRGGWYVARLVFDGYGHLLGRTERACYDQRAAVEIARTDALRLTAPQYRTIAAAESRAKRVHEEAESKREAHADLMGELRAALDARDALDAEIVACRKAQRTLPAEADLPKPPENLPSHLRMRYEAPPTRESEAAREVALQSVRVLRDSEVKERERAVAMLGVAADVGAAQDREMERGESEWLGAAQAAIRAGWG